MLQNPGIHENYDEKYFGNDYLEYKSDRSRRSIELSPFGTFIYKTAKRLEYLTKSVKTDEDIIQGIEDTINFMIQLKNGGVSNHNLGTLYSTKFLFSPTSSKSISGSTNFRIAN